MALTHVDRNHLANLSAAANGVAGKAMTTHAMAPGMGSSSVPGQLVAAAAYWTALSGGGGLSAAEAALVADAITHLGLLLAYLNNPSGGAHPGSR